MGLLVAAPLAGTAVPLSEVPDPVFAEAVVGPGLAVVPDETSRVAAAPIAGTLVKLKPHAFVVADDAGRAVLVHLGIDTVSLGGDGFRLLAEQGQQVAAGDPVVRWTPTDVTRRGLSPICPVIALEAPADAVMTPALGRVTAGEPLFTWA